MKIPISIPLNKKDIVEVTMKRLYPNYSIDCWGLDVLEDEDSYMDNRILVAGYECGNLRRQFHVTLDTKGESVLTIYELKKVYEF